MGASASLQEDAHSQGVAAATLNALAPAWLAAGRPSSQLVDTLLAATTGMNTDHRVALLAALLPALPEVQPWFFRFMLAAPFLYIQYISV